MPNQSSTQRKQVASSQTGPIAPTRTKPDKYLIQVTARSGIAWENVELTQDELRKRVKEIVRDGYETMKDGRAILFPAVSLEKIEVIKQ